MTTLRHPRRVLAASLALGLSAELLFDGPRLGVSLPLFVFAMLSALALIAGREGLHGARRVAWLAAPLLLLSSFVAVRASPELVALDVIACLVLGGLLAHGFSGTLHLPDLKLWELAARPVEGWAWSLWSAPTVVRESVSFSRAGEAAKAHGGTVARALVITLPVLTVFIALLCAGDPAFADAMVRLAELLTPGDGGGSGLLWVLVTSFLAAGLLAHALRRRGWQSPPEAPPATATGGPLGAAEGLSVVGSLVVLFAGFSAVQAKSFFVERSKLIPSEPGIGWGTYTREGFVQLMIAAGLTLSLLVVLPAISRFDTAGVRRAFQCSSCALIALTLVILATATNRLVAYEEAYGFSVTRVFGHVFAFALGAVLLWRALTLWVWRGRFAIGALAAALGWLVTLNALDPERFVVEKNLARYDRIGRLNLAYLVSLSEDAMPVLREGLAARPDATKGLDALALGLCANRASDDHGWQSANLARARARIVPDGCSRL